MKEKVPLIVDNDYIKTELHDSLIVVESKRNIFESLTDIKESFSHLEWLKEVEKDETIKGVLYLGNKSSFCVDAYIGFLSSITGENLKDASHKSIQHFVDHNARSKQLNMIYNFITAFVNFPKLIFLLLDGCIVTPFIGIAMAADIRIGTPNTEFSFYHKKYGLHPSGAVPFFFSRFLGHSKAQEILYSVDSLNVKQLRELSLIHYITDIDFRENSIKYACSILDQEYSTLKSTKYLIRATLLTHFDNYTETEKRITMF